MSDAVIKVMINPAPPPAPVVAAVAPMSMDPSLPPPEVGVYWKDGSPFVLIQGRALDQTKVGGKAGSYFTDGMSALGAYVDGPHSSIIVKEHRPTFYLYVPDGSDALDYVLIVMNKKSNRREFQIGSFGGVTGGKWALLCNEGQGGRLLGRARRDSHLPWLTLERDLKLRQSTPSLWGRAAVGDNVRRTGDGNRSGGAAAGRPAIPASRSSDGSGYPPKKSFCFLFALW